MKAKRKDELRHDQFVEGVVGWTERARRELVPYKNFIFAGAGLFVVVLIGSAVMQASEQSKMTEAWGELEKVAKKVADGEDGDFNRLATLYKGSKTEPWILFYAAEDALRKLETATSDDEKAKARENAVSSLEKLSTGFPLHPIAKRSGILLAQQYADSEEWEKAAKTYKSVLSSNSEYVGKYIKEKAQFGLGYVSERLGNVKEAIDNYEKLESLERSHWADMAKFRLERLRAAGYGS